MQQQQETIQQVMIRQRLPFVIIMLVLASVVLLYQLASFQWLSPDVAREFELRSRANYGAIRRLPAERGLIYDRDGQPLAINTIQYGIGVSPNLVTEPSQVASQLAVILGLDEIDLYQRLTSDREWEIIARPVTAEVGQEIADLANNSTDVSYVGLTIEPLSRRFYPQGALAGQVIGFVIEDNDGRTRGAIGVEGYYNDSLAGRILDQEVSTIPFDLPVEEQEGRSGQDLILTIDRDIQFWAEAELLLTINEQGASGGTIIVMDPRNGDILAMASYPTFDPNNFISVEDPDLLKNSAISEIYEPGSIMKVITVAGALEQGVITPEWTYNDQGVLEVGGRLIENWDNNAYGVVDTTNLLVNSLNIGAATVALEMEPEGFYSTMDEFGFGDATGVDLVGEEAGILKVPGDPDWSESDLATNSFGQGVSVTPLQMITAVSAIANGGLMYQPRIVRQRIDGDEVIDAQPTALARPISAETAATVRDMMVRVVEEGATLASIPGYSIAGKTGTAQIPSALGYETGTNSTIASFVGFFPADDPQVIVLVKIDRPTVQWGSEVAAPTFRRLAERLVILMQIPSDADRDRLASSGGIINNP